MVVNLTVNSPAGNTTWHWDLGNGNISTLRNPSATYSNPGTYTVKLIVSDGHNVDSSMQTITVFSPPSVDFTCDRTAVCPSDSIQFTNLATPGSAPINQYAWGFGNGIASSNINAAYRYPQSGIYDVTLVVQDTNGCNAHITKTAFMTVWPKPTASFTASPLVSCAASQVVNFTDQSVGHGLTYNWAFGDSTSDNTATPSHTYAYGKYKAALYVANNFGCVDSFKKDVAVINLRANFSATKLVICEGETVHFSDESPMPGSGWHWNFGDGTSSARQNPGKAYSTAGVYSVTFVVSDAVCKDSSTRVGYIKVTQGFSVGFSADNQNSCTTPFTVNFTSHAPAGVSLQWTFGDGNTSTSTNPSNTYNLSSTFPVSLTAVDSSGCTVVTTVPGFINTSKPGVKFFPSDTLTCLGSHVAFYNRTSNATRYFWQFGDGDTSSSINPTHIYRNYGYYTVSLTAWDSIGCDSTLVRTSLVHVDSAFVDFNVDETFSMCPPLVSVFSSQANRPDLKYYWEFGDGYTDTVAGPTHIYFHPGVYTVKLKVVSSQGCSYTKVYNNMINVQGPSGIFNMSATTGCIPVNVNFTANPSANTQSVICDLGDGTLYTDSLNFNYTYNSVNIFHPKFILTDQIGCSVAYSLDSIVTHTLPVLNLRDTAICEGQNVRVVLGNDQYLWDNLPASSCNICSDVTLHPIDTTEYKVTATSTVGCSVTNTFKIMVDKLPVLKAQDTIKICKNGTVTMDIVESAFGVNWSPSTYLSNTHTFAPVASPAEDMNYIVTAYNRLGCTVSQSVPVKVYNKIPFSVTADTSVCQGTSVQLNVITTDTLFHNVSYTWNTSTDLSATDIADPIATVRTNSETFRVTAHSGNCPATSAAVTVSVKPSAHVKLPTEIVTTANAEISIAPSAGNLTSYNWSAKDQLSCTDCAATTLIPTEDQMVYVHGTNQYGCTAQDSALIHILNCDPSSIFVPNTFTPNTDGTNDKLYVRSKTIAQLEYFRLFNRWGAIVYETKNIAEGWDGSINGQLAEEGVYVYQLSGKCESGYDVSTSGTVTLVR